MKKNYTQFRFLMLFFVLMFAALYSSDVTIQAAGKTVQAEKKESFAKTINVFNVLRLEALVGYRGLEPRTYIFILNIIPYLVYSDLKYFKPQLHKYKLNSKLR